MTKLGFIGIGNMGAAILRGILQKNLLSTGDIYVYDTDVQKIKKLQQEFGVLTAQSGSAMVFACDMVILAVKPYICAAVLKECAGALRDKALISIVAGWDRGRISALAPDCRIMRVMPNMPCMVGEGMVALDMDHTLQPDEFLFAQQLFEATGRTETVVSSQLPAVTGLSGSGPAYVFMFIEAMADGAVRMGMPRDMAYRFAAQTVQGAARMVLQTGQHPGALKDAVCSPAGTTIEGVAELEKGGARAAIMNAVVASAEKAAHT